MRRDLERRLQAVETAEVGGSTSELWIKLADSRMRGPRGEVITQEDFEARCFPAGTTLLILPDNGRDAMDDEC